MKKIIGSEQVDEAVSRRESSLQDLVFYLWYRFRCLYSRPCPDEEGDEQYETEEGQHGGQHGEDVDSDEAGVGALLGAQVGHEVAELQLAPAESHLDGEQQLCVVTQAGN